MRRATAAVLGSEVTHRVDIIAPDAAATAPSVVAATVPGQLGSFNCDTFNQQDALCPGCTAPPLGQGSYGNPSIHAQTTAGGVGTKF